MTAKQKTITISADSTADLSTEYYEQHGVVLARMGVNVGDETYVDGVDCSVDDVYRWIEQEGKAPKTSAGIEIEYKQMFEKSTKDGGYHIHINISSQLSVSHQNALRAAEGMGNVYVVDSRTLSVGVGQLVMKAVELRDAGATAEEIVGVLERLREKTLLFFVIESLKFLHRGGRVGGLKLLGANVLGIRPTFTTDKDGKLIQGEKKFRGKMPLVTSQFTSWLLSGAYKNADKSRVFIAHTWIDQTIVDSMKATLEKHGFKEVIVCPVGPNITIHSGRGSVGIVCLEQ